MAVRLCLLGLALGVSVVGGTELTFEMGPHVEVGLLADPSSFLCHRCLPLSSIRYDELSGGVFLGKKHLSSSHDSRTYSLTSLTSVAAMLS
jgi:hypothetical protein